MDTEAITHLYEDRIRKTSPKSVLEARLEKTDLRSPSDPFARFLKNLAQAKIEIKEEKSDKTAVASSTQPQKVSSTNSDPLKDFMSRLADALKVNQPNEPDQSQSSEKTKSYVAALGPAGSKVNEEDLKINKAIENQFAQYKQQFPNSGFSGGGGGGTNAIQYGLGGTMDGDLNVTGKYLSGGVDLASIIASSGGGGSGGGTGSSPTDSLVSGSNILKLNANGTIDFPANTIAPQLEQTLTLQASSDITDSYTTAELSPYAFQAGSTVTDNYTKIDLSPYAFFVHDNNFNSIAFNTVDNNIVITSQDEYEWTFGNTGVLTGPSGTLVTTDIQSTGRILSGSTDVATLFATNETLSSLRIDGGEY